MIALDPPPAGRPIVSAMTPTELPTVIAEHLAAVNAFDVDAIVATFADDAYVNDARREIVGVDAIRRWVEQEMVGDHVTMEVREVAVLMLDLTPRFERRACPTRGSARRRLPPTPRAGRGCSGPSPGESRA